MRKRFSGASKIILALVLAAALLGYLGAADAQDGSVKTLGRLEDPVVITADKLSDVKDSEIDELALFAWDGSAFKPIPFQVDERAKNGMFVYPEGKDANPKDGDRKVNGKDELVFMAWDSAGKAPTGSELPCDADKSVEIEISDPIDNGKAWVYLAECDDDPPRSPVDYVRNEYDGERDWVKTDRYHFAEIRGKTFFDRLALKGQSGKVGPNLVDRIKGRTKIEAAAGLIKLTPGEASLEGSIKAWIDGPVRVVHLMAAYVELSVIKLNLGGQAENEFYPNYFVTPIELGMPFNPSTVLSSFQMRYAIDWNQKMEGAKYYDPINAKGVVLDGKMSDDEKNMDYKTAHEWYAITGPEGNLVVRLVIPKEWQKAVPQRLYYVDDVTAADEPESDPGQRCPGFLMDTMVDIPAGKHKYYLYYMSPDKAPPASVPDMLNILDHPLKIKASKLGD